MSSVARSPRYWLRRHLAVRTLRMMSPGSIIEIGCGTGELIPAVAGLGYHGVGLEISLDVAAIARQATLSVREQFEIISDPREIHSGQFDYACAFEVLEHVEHDLEQLSEWTRWLVPGGVFLASVPAHMRFWSRADEAVGHYRRYERSEIRALFAGAGLVVESLWSYGFPLTGLTRFLRSFHTAMIPTSSDQGSRTLASALVSTAKVPRAFDLVSRVVGAVGHAAQLGFLNGDLGDGYFVVARRRSS